MITQSNSCFLHCLKFIAVSTPNPSHLQSKPKGAKNATVVWLPHCPIFRHCRNLYQIIFQSHHTKSAIGKADPGLIQVKGYWQISLSTSVDAICLTILLESTPSFNEYQQYHRYQQSKSLYFWIPSPSWSLYLTKTAPIIWTRKGSCPSIIIGIRNQQSTYHHYLSLCLLLL